jgi:hypothetical protein
MSDRSSHGWRGETVTTEEALCLQGSTRSFAPSKILNSGMEQVIQSERSSKDRRGRRMRRAGLIAALFSAAPLILAVEEPTQYQVEAAFLLNFTKFVEWPAAAFESPTSPIAICILGDDPFGRSLDHLIEGEQVNGRRVTVQRLKRSPAPNMCQVLFLGSAAEGPRMPPGAGVLTVGEGEEFLRQGGMIAFVIENRRVRFSVNQSAAERVGLKLSSRLLRVARSVER